MRKTTKIALTLAALAALSGVAWAAGVRLISTGWIQWEENSSAACAAGKPCGYVSSSDHQLHHKTAAGVDSMVPNVAASPTWSGTHTFSNAATSPGLTAPASTALMLQSPLAAGTSGTGAVILQGSAASNGDYITTFDQASNQRVWAFTGSSGTGPTLNVFNNVPALVGGLQFTTSGLLPNGGSMTSIGSAASQWATSYVKQKLGTQQAPTATGTVSITVGAGETARLTQSGVVTSLTLSTCAADEHFTLIIVGNGSAGVTTITNAKLTGGSFTWPGNAVRIVLFFGCDTTDSMWVQIGSTSTVS